MENTEVIDAEQPSRVVYDNMKELIAEWQASENDAAIWDFLGMPEYMFKTWLKKCRDGVVDS